MAAAAAYTPEDLLLMPDGDRFELIDGQLVEPEMSILASLVSLEVMRLVSNFVRGNHLGFALSSECSYQCFPHKPSQVRKPDGSFIRKGRLPADQLERGHARIAPDLAIEVISPNDLYPEVDVKLEDYFLAGIPLIWVINPELRTVRVYHADGSSVRLREHDELTGEDVLPGFRCRVGELFPTIATDPDQKTT